MNHPSTDEAVRNDVLGKVTGTARYVDDLQLDGAFYGTVVRSPVHHARIVAIDTTKAAKVPGIIAVITAEDVPGEKFGAVVKDRSVLARDVVRHVGEPVAIVVATTRQAARLAMAAVSIDFEELPAVFDPIRALDPDSPRLHPDGNLLTQYDIQTGDVESALASADLVVERTFRVPRVSPAYLEPEVAAARWDDGSLTVWVSSQMPFHDRSAISSVLGLPERVVRVVVPGIGGAFGGKEDSSLPVLAAVAAQLSRGTVRMCNTREESMCAHPKRHPAVMNWRMGVSKQGAILALDADAYLDTGAYASYGPAVGGVLAEASPGSYRIPNTRLRCAVVYTNSPISGAMRGFGAPQAAFATESLIDIAAAELRVDPIEFRRRNLLRQGDRNSIGVLLKQSPTTNLCLDHGADAVRRLRDVPSTDNRASGVGVALNTQAMGLGYGLHDESENTVEWLPTGRVEIDIGTPDMGQGTASMAAEITARSLGIDYSSVDVAQVDTSTSPNGGVTCASRMTYMIGNALRMASEDAIDVLVAEASHVLEVPRSELRYIDGRIARPGGGTGIPAAEIARMSLAYGVRLIGRGRYTFPYPEDITPQDHPVGMPHVMFCHGLHVARVEVDIELGMIEVTHVVAVHDVGRVISRVGVEGQIEGALSMGLGYALLEEQQLKADRSWTSTFTEYLLPTTRDMPVIDITVLEQREPSGPFGAKGVGEMGGTPVAPAVANAVADATGARVTTLPIRPDRLLAALEQQ